MSVYVGIDVHRKRSQVAVVDESGKVLANGNVPNGVEPILGVIGGLPPGTPAAFEAAFGTGWLVELLEDYGFAPHLVHSLRCKAIASARLKNDKAGAAILAQLLRADLLPEAWIAPPPVRQLRALLRHRAALALISALETVIDRLDWEIRQRGRSDPRVKVLTQLPGVGPFIALVILAEIGDVSRFGSARKLASWAGLTPTVHGSDRVAHYGHIWKTGLGVAALGAVRGGADRQALATVRRQLPGHRPAAREEDRHHRGRPQAAHPRLAPAHRRRARNPATRRSIHRPGRDAVTDQEEVARLRASSKICLSRPCRARRTD
jgi:transposase